MKDIPLICYNMPFFILLRKIPTLSNGIAAYGYPSAEPSLHGYAALFGRSDGLRGHSPLFALGVRRA